MSGRLIFALSCLAMVIGAFVVWNEAQRAAASALAAAAAALQNEKAERGQQVAALEFQLVEKDRLLNEKPLSNQQIRSVLDKMRAEGIAIFDALLSGDEKKLLDCSKWEFRLLEFAEKHLTTQKFQVLTSSTVMSQRSNSGFTFSTLMSMADNIRENTGANETAVRLAVMLENLRVVREEVRDSC